MLAAKEFRNLAMDWTKAPDRFPPEQLRGHCRSQRLSILNATEVPRNEFFIDWMAVKRVAGLIGQQQEDAQAPGAIDD